MAKDRFNLAALRRRIMPVNASLIDLSLSKSCAVFPFSRRDPDLDLDLDEEKEGINALPPL